MGLSRIRLFTGLAVGILAISFAAVFVRFAQAEGVPTLSIAAWRLTFASLVLLPYSWARHRDEIQSFSPRQWGLLIASGVFLGLHFATWIASLGYTSIASSVVLVSMGPLFVGLGSWFFLRERPGQRVIVGIALAAAGSIVISWSDFGQGQDQLLGDLLALTGAVMVAGYLMIGRSIRSHHSLVPYIAPVYGFAMLTLLAIAIAGRQTMWGFSASAYGWMVLLGFVPQLIGHSTLNWALGHLSATYVALVTLSEPLGSSLLAYLILREGFTWLIGLGGVLILLGIGIASRSEVPRVPDRHQASDG